MNSFIEKLTEYLLKKQWVIFCLSILAGFGGYYLLPSNFVDKMPFSSRDWNVVTCIVLLSIVAYLLFSLIRFVAEKIAQIKGLTPEEVEKATWENGRRFFGV